MKPEEIVTDKELDAVIKDEHYLPNKPKREYIKFALLKIASGYANGHTIGCVLHELGLVVQNHLKLTKKGQEYLWACFSDGYN